MVFCSGSRSSLVERRQLCAVIGDKDRDGYDPGVSLILDAFGHLMDAASRIGAQAWATQQAQRLAEGPCNLSRSHMQRVLAESLARWSKEPDGN
jgi:hypothetical protein